ncbi:hypothetical protein BDW27_102476 [Nocardiopsis sp. L17-MgMaSL7]|nr:hypothetical protein BDW27_102476 [Nocardiopsis sp. L17-MgMaSL7]
MRPSAVLLRILVCRSVCTGNHRACLAHRTASVDDLDRPRTPSSLGLASQGIEAGPSPGRERPWKLPSEVRPRVAAVPATDAPLRPGRSYQAAAHHHLCAQPQVPSPLDEVQVAPASLDAGRAVSSRARPGTGAPRAPRHRPHTTHAAPCTTPAGGADQPGACPCELPQHGAEEPSHPPCPQSSPEQIHGLGADAAPAAVDAPQPPVECSARSGYRTQRRAPPPGPNAGARPSPVGACGAARYAFPRSPPAAIRWG